MRSAALGPLVFHACVSINPLTFVALTASGHGCAQKTQAVIGQWLGQVGGINTCTLP